MIWRWLTCSNLLAICAFGGMVSGNVQLRDSRVDAVSKRGNYSGVVISLVPAVPFVAGEPAKGLRTVMLQKDKMFTPHVLPIPVGATVDFPNADPIFHNAFSSYSGQIFDVGLYPPGSTRSVRFTRPGVVRIFCNIHPSMSSIILVLASPYFAVSDAGGAFRLDAPAGEYQLNVFHERATENTLSALTRHVTVGAGPIKIPAIVVSESGYLMAPHKNKYGNDYPPDSVSDSLYPGAKK